MSEANHQTLRPGSMTDSERTAARSMGELEKKEMGAGESGLPSAAVSVHEPTTDEKEAQVNEKRNSQASIGDEEDDFDYPTGWRLAVITLALCLSVFCMALVGPGRRCPVPGCKAHNRRTTQLSQQPFLVSQISSKRSMMSVGMDRRTYSPPVRRNCYTASSTRSTRSNGSTSSPWAFLNSAPSSAVSRPTRPRSSSDAPLRVWALQASSAVPFSSSQARFLFANVRPTWA